MTVVGSEAGRRVLRNLRVHSEASVRGTGKCDAPRSVGHVRGCVLGTPSSVFWGGHENAHETHDVGVELLASGEAGARSWHTCIGAFTWCGGTSALSAWISLHREESRGKANPRRDACCVSWSRQCRIPKKEIQSRAEAVLNRCGSGSSGTVLNAGSCLGTVCVSNRGRGCGDGPHVNDPLSGPA